MLRCPPTHALALAAALWFAAAFTAPASAQDATVHKLPSPAWAVEFGLANASLSSFDGAMISLRQQKSAHAAWRYGLSVSASTSKYESDRTVSSSTVFARDDNKHRTSDVSLSVTRLTFPAPDAVVRPWFGAGLELGWSSMREERSSIYYNTDGSISSARTYDDRQHGPSAGVVGLFGLEWSASERFAIHAQYGQAVRYRRLDNEYDETESYLSTDTFYHREGPTSEWSTSGVSARAGVSVFW